jgi:hypothetical protein
LGFCTNGAESQRAYVLGLHLNEAQGHEVVLDKRSLGHAGLRVPPAQAAQARDLARDNRQDQVAVPRLVSDRNFPCAVEFAAGTTSMEGTVVIVVM